jgi:hypothetical protein
VEWISRLRSSKSASTIPNIVIAKPSIVVTKPNIAIVGRCVKGRGRKGTGALQRSWRQIVILVDRVDLPSDPLHSDPNRSLSTRVS